LEKAGINGIIKKWGLKSAFFFYSQDFPLFKTKSIKVP